MCLYFCSREGQVEKLQESTRDLFNHCFQVNEGNKLAVDVGVLFDFQ